MRSYAEKHFSERRDCLRPVLGQIEEGLLGCTDEEAVLMKFFYGTMPLRDAGEYSFGTFLGYVRHALWLREQVDWCRELPEELFVHHVLYYRINSEDIGDCRAFFYEQLKERVRGLDAYRAAVEVNYWCAEHATYESTDTRTAAPMTLYRCGKGRCGEESTFTVTALRSVGLAARQVYTPRWAHCDDNHAWVEVYVNGGWHFLGACEPEEELDRGWFVGPAGRAVLIHSRTFGDFAAGESEELIGREGLLAYHNRTAAYTKTRLLRIRVKDEEGRPAAGAQVSVCILNMAEYFPAANLTADGQGNAQIRLGLGDVRLTALWDGRFAEAEADLTERGEAELVLSPEKGQAPEETDWTESLIRAPREAIVREAKLTQEQEQTGAKRLAEAAALREKRFAAFGEAESRRHPQERGRIRIAGENCGQLALFLERDSRPERVRLLHTLSDKDFKDLRAEVLEDHLTARPEGLPEEVYERELLCPRIYLEELTPYRSFIRSYFTEEQKTEFARDPERIWAYLESHICYEPREEYETLCATPVGCLRMGRGSLLSRKILFAAICRSLQLPARIERSTMEAQYWAGDRFVSLRDAGAGNGEEALVRLTARAGETWGYFKDWTLGRWGATGFETMDYEGLSFGEEGLSLRLSRGRYRLVTARRLPDGSQYTAFRIFDAGAGQERCLAMHGWRQEQPGLEERPLGNLELTDENGQTHRLAELAGEGCILAFLGVGAEPTEHVLNELLECSAVWNETNGRLLAVLRSRRDLENATLRRVLDNLDGIRLFYGGEDSCRETAEIMGTDALRLPVMAAVAEGGLGIYACSGYNVGSVELMRKLLADKGREEG
ncbi:MAG: transglutaminase-like domain-containing protein [Eubacteriales bacterium]|nr:transglutaminase-like domain-containing protein [Eubacteriales bacterium]